MKVLAYPHWIRVDPVTQFNNPVPEIFSLHIQTRYNDIYLEGTRYKLLFFD